MRQEHPESAEEKPIVDAFQELITYIYRMEYQRSGINYLKAAALPAELSGQLSPAEQKTGLDVIYEEDSALIDQSHDFTLSRKLSKKEVTAVETSNFTEGKDGQKGRDSKSPLLKKPSVPKQTVFQTNTGRKVTEIQDSTGSQHPRRTPPRKVAPTNRDKSDEKAKPGASPLSQKGDRAQDRGQNSQQIYQTAKLKAKRDQMKQALEMNQPKEQWAVPIKPTGQQPKKQTSSVPRKVEEIKKREPAGPEPVKPPSPTQSPRGPTAKESYSTLFGKSETSSAIEQPQQHQQPKPAHTLGLSTQTTTTTTANTTESVRAQIARERSVFLQRLNRSFLDSI